MSTLGENILYMRKKLGITQEELAQRVGYKSKSSINKIELGLNDIPRNKIVKFAEALNTTPAYLMNWNQDVFIPDDENPYELKMRDAFDRLDLDNQILVSQFVEDVADKKTLPQPQNLTEEEKAFLDWFRQIPEDVQKMYNSLFDLFGQLPCDSQKIYLEVLRATLSAQSQKNQK